MALWIIELSDSAVSVFRDGQRVDSSPGIAVVDNKQVFTGADATARQYLNPRAVHSRFWQQLNEAQLPGASRVCRHHADLAYHHLAAILDRCGHPNEAVIAVPAHYDSNELALLLAICEALKLKVAGFVDVNVAALSGAAPRGNYRVADLYLHHATLTTVEVGDECVRNAVELVEQCGLQRAEDAWVDLIADAFLEQSRFDPLHEAASEHLLHEQLPVWLTQARQSQEVVMELDYHNARFTARLPAVEFKRITHMVLAPIAEKVMPGENLLIHNRISELAGATDVLPGAQLLSASDVVAGIARHRLALRAEDGPRFVTSLPANDAPSLTLKPAQPRRNSEQSATHLLCGGTAVAIAPRALALRETGLAAADNSDEVTVEVEGNEAVITTNRSDVNLNGGAISGQAVLRAGDVIRLGSLSVTAIRAVDRVDM